MTDVSVGAGVDPFAAVVGQERAVDLLRAAAGRPSHAYLFVGPRGSGKLAAAWAFAGEVLARAEADPDSPSDAGPDGIAGSGRDFEGSGGDPAEGARKE